MSLLQFLNNGYFAGKVGIGTNSPERLLSLYSDNAETTPRLLIEQDGTGDAVMAFSLTSGQGWSMGIDNSLGDAFMIHNSAGGVDSSSQLTIATDGDVGIGTVSPAQKLHVSNGKVLVDVTSSVGTELILQNLAVDQFAADKNYHEINFITSSTSSETTGGYVRIKAGQEVSGNDNRSYLGFWTAPDDATVTEKMRITSTGNVGIGTTTPASKLNVGGNAGGFATAMQVWQDGETAASGDIGGKAATFFGESGVSNSSIVNIYSTNGYTGQNGGEIGFGGKYASNASVAQFAKIRSFKTNASNGGSNYGGGLEFWTRPNGSAAVPRMTILGDGNVGIGETNPSEKLDVAGNIKITAALLSNQENTDIDSAAAEVVAQVAISYTAAFFDFVVKKGTNVRSGTVYACHDGTNVEFTETSTNDLGDTSDVTLSVDISGTNMRLLATVTSDDWSVKSLIRAI